jgi:hypothetical protein
MLVAHRIAVASGFCLLLSSCAATVEGLRELRLLDHLHFYSADHEGDFDNRLLAARGLDEDGPSPGLGLTWDFVAPSAPERGIEREDLLALLVEHRRETALLLAEAGILREETPLEFTLGVEATAAAEPVLEEPPRARPPPEIVAEEPRGIAPPGKVARPGNSQSVASLAP